MAQAPTSSRVLLLLLTACGCAHVDGPSPSDPDASIEVATGLFIGRPSKRHVPMAHIDEKAVRQVVRDHASEVRKCYEQQLAKDPELEGRLILWWGINEVGRAGTAHVTHESTLANDDLARCISAQMQGWRFPGTIDRGVALVMYSWRFQRDRTTPADVASPGDP